MAVKTSLQVKTFNPVTNKNVTKTATYSNPNATDAQLNSFAQNFYGGLSDNTVNSVIRVDKQNITNVQSLPSVSYTLPDEAYKIDNALFCAALYCQGSSKHYWVDDFVNTDSVVLKSIVPTSTPINPNSFNCVFEIGGTETTATDCNLFSISPKISIPKAYLTNSVTSHTVKGICDNANSFTDAELETMFQWILNNQTSKVIDMQINKTIENAISGGTDFLVDYTFSGNTFTFTAKEEYLDRMGANKFRIQIQNAHWIYGWTEDSFLPQYTDGAQFGDFTYANEIFTARFGT